MYDNSFLPGDLLHSNFGAREKLFRTEQSKGENTLMRILFAEDEADLKIGRAHV